MIILLRMWISQSLSNISKFPLQNQFINTFLYWIHIYPILFRVLHNFVIIVVGVFLNAFKSKNIDTKCTISFMKIISALYTICIQYSPFKKKNELNRSDLFYMFYIPTVWNVDAVGRKDMAPFCHNILIYWKCWGFFPQKKICGWK